MFHPASDSDLEEGVNEMEHHGSDAYVNCIPNSKTQSKLITSQSGGSSDALLNYSFGDGTP